MNAKIVLEWDSNLLKNQAYVNGDPKLGHTDACLKAMWDIKMLFTTAAWDFQDDRRIQVVITAYRPRANIDAQNLVDSVSDALEDAIHRNDADFDVSAIGKLDATRPRIEIEVSYVTQQEDDDGC